MDTDFPTNRGQCKSVSARARELSLKKLFLSFFTVRCVHLLVNKVVDNENKDVVLFKKIRISTLQYTLYTMWQLGLPVKHAREWHGRGFEPHQVRRFSYGVRRP